MTNPDTTQPTTAPDEFAPGDRVTILVVPDNSPVAITLTGTVEFPILRPNYIRRTLVPTGQYQVVIDDLGTVRVDADRLVAAAQ